MRLRTQSTLRVVALVIMSTSSCGDGGPEGPRVTPEEWTGLYSLMFTCMADCENRPSFVPWWGPARITINEDGSGSLCDVEEFGGCYTQAYVRLHDGRVVVPDLSLDGGIFLHAMTLEGTMLGFATDTKMHWTWFNNDDEPEILVSTWRIHGTKTADRDVQ